jgi:hypothetical protein
MVSTSVMVISIVDEGRKGVNTPLLLSKSVRERAEKKKIEKEKGTKGRVRC